MGEKAAYLVPETLKEKECRMGEKAAYLVPETLKGKNVAWERKPHTSFRRRSRPFGQAYAPSEVSGFLFADHKTV